jgi:hypothetical protein
MKEAGSALPNLQNEGWQALDRQKNWNRYASKLRHRPCVSQLGVVLFQIRRILMAPYRQS